MKAEAPSALEREGLLLFGRFCAGLSHEMSNVLNIINELAGLERDIVGDATRDGSGAAVARIADLAGRIKAQVARGEELNRLLHGLGHSVDSSATAFDLGEVLGLLGALEARAARLARVELEVRRPEHPVTLEGDPFALLLALDACIGRALATSGAGRRIEVCSEQGDDELRLVVSSADPLTDGDGDLVEAPELRLGLAAWGAVARIEPADGKARRAVIGIPLGGSGAPLERVHPSLEES
jgi:hypothetical protein